MKYPLTVFATILTISTTATHANAIDPDTQSQLSQAHLTAHAATRIYWKQPNGTTHAMADLAFCNFSEQRAFARDREFFATVVDKQLAELRHLRTIAKLPAVDCASPSTALIPGQVAAEDRPFRPAH